MIAAIDAPWWMYVLATTGAASILSGIVMVIGLWCFNRRPRQ